MVVQVPAEFSAQHLCFHRPGGERTQQLVRGQNVRGGNLYLENGPFLALKRIDLNHYIDDVSYLMYTPADATTHTYHVG
jgi:hypothetical protein